MTSSVARQIVLAACCWSRWPGCSRRLTPSLGPCRGRVSRRWSGPARRAHRSLAAEVAGPPRYVNLLLLSRWPARRWPPCWPPGGEQLITPGLARRVVARDHGGGQLRAESGSGPAHHRPPAPRTASGCFWPRRWRALAALLGPLTRLLIVSATRSRRQGVPRGPVLLRGRAARAVRPGRRPGRGRRGRAADDPLGVRAGDTPNPGTPHSVPRTDLIWIERHRTVRERADLALRTATPVSRCSGGVTT